MGIFDKNIIGRVYLYGTIGGYGITSLGDPNIKPDTVREGVKAALNDNAQGIIFDIDSTGGKIAPTKEIYDFIKKIELPKVALVRDSALSGGYYIACACDRIIANPSGFVGSIGVVSYSLDLSELIEKLGIKPKILYAGKHKEMSSPYRPYTADEKKFIQNQIDTHHKRFIEDVAKSRGKEIKDIEKYAEGLLYNAEDAVNMGLVDELGYIEEAIKYIGEKANIQEFTVKDYIKKRSTLERILGRSVSNLFHEACESFKNELITTFYKNQNFRY